ncbi:MAG: hypothetical protein HY401_00250 [Elusimicrobia bacterium]|nr:hypothetical protein [Elusimicrobiota bacterium]
MQDVKDTLIALPAPFVDERGLIQPLLERAMQSALIIHSKKGSLRANHYHKTDWHYCYLVTGSMEYYYRKTNSAEKPACLKVKAGQMIFTPPMVDHAMKFLEDTIFVALSRNQRDQENYEDDVIRVELVRP